MNSRVTNPLLPPSANLAGRIFVRVLAAGMLIGLFATAWVGIRGAFALEHLRQARSLSSQVSDNITDAKKASGLITEIRDETSAAHRLTSDPIWRLGQRVPYVGPQLTAVGEATAALDTMSGSAFKPLLDVSRDFSVDSLTPRDGAIDTRGLVKLREASAEGARHMATAQRQIEGIDHRGLLPPLANVIGTLDDQVGDVARAVDGVHRASVLLPIVLGENGSRDYLVLVQNNAEWRSLGGLNGAMFVMHTNKGKIDLRDNASATDIKRFAQPVVDLSPEMLKLFAPNPATYVQNVTQIPDFAESGRIAQAMWKKHTGTRVDGVISLDVVTLSYLLKATGPVEVTNPATGNPIKITSDNAVKFLLNTVYLDFPVEDQDAFYEDITNAVFSELMSGSAAPRALLDSLITANNENRLYLWSDDRKEQSALDGTRLQGNLPHTSDHQTQFGIYLNDGTGSKLDYYMKSATGVTWCSENSSKAVAALRLRLDNNAPKNVKSLPSSVIGELAQGPTKGRTRTLAYIYLPRGAEVIATEDLGDGQRSDFTQRKHDGRTVLIWETLLSPKQGVTADIRVSTPWTPRLGLVQTPTIPQNASTVSPACR